jgi:hypothetical protein
MASSLSNVVSANSCGVSDSAYALAIRMGVPARLDAPRSTPTAARDVSAARSAASRSRSVRIGYIRSASVVIPESIFASTNLC